MVGLSDSISQSTWCAEKELETKKYPLFEIFSDFRPIVERLGGYPTSGAIKTTQSADAIVEQYFLKGHPDDHAIAYKVQQRNNSALEIQQVHQVVFNFFGDYHLEGAMLSTYMANGGYPKFGAPVGNTYSSTMNDKPQILT